MIRIGLVAALLVSAVLAQETPKAKTPTTPVGQKRGEGNLVDAAEARRLREQLRVLARRIATLREGLARAEKPRSKKALTESLTRARALRDAVQRRLSRLSKAVPPFPKRQAKWVIRGKARADAMLTRQAGSERWPCKALEFSLPEVLVSAASASQWRFPPTDSPQAVPLQVARGRFPRVVAFGPGSALRIAPHPELGYFEFRYRVFGLGHLLVSWTPPGKLRQATFGDLPERPFVTSEDNRAMVLRHPMTGKIQGLSHHWAVYYLHVLPHPIFAVTDKDGYFTLPPVPDGDYILVAIHEQLGKVEKKVTIRGRNPKPLTFVFPVPPKLRAEPGKGGRPSADGKP